MIKRPANIEKIKEAICLALEQEEMAVTPETMLGRTREHKFVVARQLMSFILWNHYGWGCQAIGKETRQHYSTVIYGYAQASILIEGDGVYGRSYLMACGIIGIKPASWLHPKLTSVEVMSVKEARRRRKEMMKMKQPANVEAVGGYVVPSKWTSEERQRLNAWRRESKGIPATADKGSSGARTNLKKYSGDSK